MEAQMTIMQHLDELRVRALRMVIAVGVVTIFAMTFDLRPVDVGGVQLAYPYPDPIHNISTQVTFYMQQALLPEDVRLIQIAPGQAFFAQVHVSLLLGLTISIPLIVREIAAFISPALSAKTRIGILNVMLPAVGLFIAGVLFSYFLVIPFVLDFLYEYGQALGVETFLTISDFISFVMQFFLGFGIAFQLPILMYAISLTDVISPRFWRENFRYAVIVLVVFGAIITPDGSGITMWFVTMPMLGLYLAGMLVVERRGSIRTNT